MKQETKYAKATFAGGCFWCMEPPFEKLDGVIAVEPGYTGGITENPSYDEVSKGLSGHAEAIEITYDPNKISYKELLDVFWQQIDPTDNSGQFIDRGSQYRTAVFYHNEEQRWIAEESKVELEKSGIYKKSIVTEIIEYSKFYPAEDYHRNYYKKNPIDYSAYKSASGREQFSETIWKLDKTPMPRKFQKPSDQELRRYLTPLQYHVTRENGTETPFANEYWNNKRQGIYVDVVSGEPLFTSKDQFESDCGWPSFTKPLAPENVTEKIDTTHDMVRTEVRSKNADSHLGHVFDDGPKPTGLRYCINSAALRFIPKEDLGKAGYGEYRKLF